MDGERREVGRQIGRKVARNDKSQTTYSQKFALRMTRSARWPPEIFVDAYDSPWSRVRPPSGALLVHL
jgi:hypothetical protein